MRNLLYNLIGFSRAIKIFLEESLVKILPISDKFNDYAKKIYNKLSQSEIRAQLDLRSEKINYKIREAKLNKIPYLIIIGEHGLNSNSISLRTEDNNVLSMKFEDFTKRVLYAVKNKKHVDFD